MRRPWPRFYRAVEAFKRRLIERVIEAHGGNRTHAAKSLGLARTHLQRLMRELKVRCPQGQGGPAKRRE